MNKDRINNSLKSSDTEEWLDIVWTRPIGYLLAKGAEKLHIHPNTITIASIVFGVIASGLMISGSYYYCGQNGLWTNIFAILIFAFANFLDSADGQLARMTKQTTPLGRILDGAAGTIIFFAVYFAFQLRFFFYHKREFDFFGIEDTLNNSLVASGMLVLLTLFTGFACHSRQSRLADYYRQIHLHFLKKEQGSELTNSNAEKDKYKSKDWRHNLLWKIFQSSYVNYTRLQEKETPAFQAFYAQWKDATKTNPKECEKIKEEFLDASRPLMKWTNILTFNTRAIVLYICILSDFPLLYLAFEIVIMSTIFYHMKKKHEKISKALIKKLATVTTSSLT